MDLHGRAIFDYYNGELKTPLFIHNSYGEPEEMPVEVFFREESDFTALENCALNACSGKVLDIGAAAGALTLALQQRGTEVTALDNSDHCVKTMHLQGVKNCIRSDIWQYRETYDTLLVLMNGVGLAGTLANVPMLLEKLVSLLKPGGQILMDSSDIRYLYDEGVKMLDHYYGEISYRYAYAKELGNWFDWVYVDPTLMTSIIEDCKLQMKILHAEDTDQYLMQITR